MTLATRKSFQHVINAIEYSGRRATHRLVCWLAEIHHVQCVNSSSKYLQSEMGACLTKRDYKESHSPIDIQVGCCRPVACNATSKSFLHCNFFWSYSALWRQIENQPSPVYVVNSLFSRRPDKCLESCHNFALLNHLYHILELSNEVLYDLIPHLVSKIQ